MLDRGKEEEVKEVCMQPPGHSQLHAHWPWEGGRRPLSDFALGILTIESLWATDWEQQDPQVLAFENSDRQARQTGIDLSRHIDGILSIKVLNIHNFDINGLCIICKIPLSQSH